MIASAPYDGRMRKQGTSLALCVSLLLLFPIASEAIQIRKSAGVAAAKAIPSAVNKAVVKTATKSTTKTTKKAAVKSTGAASSSKTTTTKKSSSATKTTRKSTKTTKKTTKPTLKPAATIALDNNLDVPVVSLLPVELAPTTTIAPPTTLTAPTTLPSSASVAPVLAGVATTTSSTIPTSTTSVTTTTAPFPAPANPPLRQSAATMEPYKGMGSWVDAFDFTVQKGGKNPKFTLASVDQMAGLGVQTMYIQASRYDTADVSEPERLIPIIDRAHQLGMYVVVWYLPTLTDVNADLRRTVAIANLDVDGISIDIEARNVADVAERNRRLISYSQSLRQLLPGRFISNNIVQPNILDAIPNLWPTEYGKPPASIRSYWAPFPYIEIAPYYDLWMIQSYWTQRSAGSGWRDAYRNFQDNAGRLRATLGRPDLPVHMIGGVGDPKLPLNDLSGMLQANREVNGIGLSFYDFVVTPPSWWPYLWAARNIPDPRWTPLVPPPYVPPTQPILLPPTTTVPTTTPPAPGTPSTIVTAVLPT